MLQPCAEPTEGERSGEQRLQDQQEDPGAACRGLASPNSVLPLCMSAVLHQPVGSLCRRCSASHAESAPAAVADDRLCQRRFHPTGRDQGQGDLDLRRRAQARLDEEGMPSVH